METLDLAGVTAIIPALEEAAVIGEVVSGLLVRGIGRVVVIDGGSSDGTAVRAAEAGAAVTVQPERGYGCACIAGVAAAGEAPVLLFLDGDGAEDLDGALRVLNPVLTGSADLALGRRRVRPDEAGAQTRLAQLGNAVCSAWLRLAFGAPITDFASMKAIRRQVYLDLHLDHRRYGWTAQFLARAARAHLTIFEAPISYRRRQGTSKVSGTARGAIRAGRQMVAVLAQETLAAALERLVSMNLGSSRLPFGPSRSKREATR